MKGLSKEWRQQMKRLMKELPGLRLAYANNGHIEVTRDGVPGRVLVGGSVKSSRSMMNDIKRIKRKLQ